MSNWPLTSQTLLERLRDAEEREAWDDFVRMYRPAVYRFARRMGLQDADADDATQKVLTSVADAFQKRPPELANHRFRSWMATVTRNTVLKLIQREGPRRASGGTDAAMTLQQAPADDAAATWHHEEQTQLFRTAAAAVKANCTPAVWLAFEQTAVHGRSCESVADELGVSIGVVYASRSRVLKRIRKAVEQLQEDQQ